MTSADANSMNFEHAVDRGYIRQRDDYLRRLRRIEGQARGLQRMVEDDKYCIDILTQISAMTKALQSVALGLLDDHLGHCVTLATKKDRTPACGCKKHQMQLRGLCVLSPPEGTVRLQLELALAN